MGKDSNDKQASMKLIFKTATIRGYNSNQRCQELLTGVKTNKDPINKTPKVNRNDVQCSRPKREAVSKARYMEIYWKKCRTM